jgi:hypothetical protein
MRPVDYMLPTNGCVGSAQDYMAPEVLRNPSTTMQEGRNVQIAALEQRNIKPYNEKVGGRACHASVTCPDNLSYCYSANIHKTSQTSGGRVGGGRACVRTGHR